MPVPSTESCILVLWMFMIGGVIGSFLNVVVYRLPLGMSIVHPPSHCPKCGKPIRWYDNVPIIGWIILRGRCRQCGNPISRRYPTVEAVTAIMFALLAAVEFLSEGANLPRRSFEVADNLFLRQSSMGQVYGVYLYHMLLLCTLLCAALIEYDGKRAPLKLFVPALAVGAIAPLIAPWLRPVAAWGYLPAWLAGAVDGLAGLAVGALAGGVAWWIEKMLRRSEKTSKKKSSKKNARARSPTSVPPALACVGLFLGWQAVALIAIATAAVVVLVWLVGRLLGRPKLAELWNPTMLLGVVTLVWILAWAKLVTS